MSDADCTPGREPRSVAASSLKSSHLECCTGSMSFASTQVLNKQRRSAIQRWPLAITNALIRLRVLLAAESAAFYMIVAPSFDWTPTNEHVSVNDRLFVSCTIQRAKSASLVAVMSLAFSAAVTLCRPRPNIAYIVLYLISVMPYLCTIFNSVMVLFRATRVIVMKHFKISRVYTIQQGVKPVVKLVWQTAVQPVWQRLNVCLHDTAGCQTGCATGLTTVIDDVITRKL